MSLETERLKASRDWVAKHSVPMQTYEVHCPKCELTYHIEATVLTELYCPLCENDEPVRAKEVKK